MYFKIEDFPNCILFFLHIEFLVLLLPIQIVTVRQSGELYLHNIMDGKVLCEVKLPDTHVIQLPWEPTLAALSSGQMLYVKGEWMNSSA